MHPIKGTVAGRNDNGEITIRTVGGNTVNTKNCGLSIGTAVLVMYDYTRNMVASVTKDDKTTEPLFREAKQPIEPEEQIMDKQTLIDDIEAENLCHEDMWFADIEPHNLDILGIWED